MFEYVKKLMEESPEEMSGTAKSPMANHLFMTNDKCEKLPEKTEQVFHHIVAKLLNLCKFTKQYIQMAVAFLCTWMKNPNLVNYKKLSHVIQVPERHTRTHTYN